MPEVRNAMTLCGLCILFIARCFVSICNMEKRWVDLFILAAIIIFFITVAVIMRNINKNPSLINNENNEAIKEMRIFTTSKTLKNLQEANEVCL